MALRFGECELDPERYELRRHGEVVHVEPKVFDVLDYLMRQRERVVTKRELLDALWPGEVVSDSVLSRAIAAVRRAVGDDRQGQHVIQTVHGRGYRFVAETGEIEQSEPSAPTAPELSPTSRPLSPRSGDTGPRASAQGGAHGGLLDGPRPFHLQPSAQ